MSADLLRNAAAEMRQRAEVATPGPWGWRYYDGPIALEAEDETPVVRVADDVADSAVSVLPWLNVKRGDMDYLESWPPEVALAVADWLDKEADLLIQYDAIVTAAAATGAIVSASKTSFPEAVAVARAYLGRLNAQAE